MLRPYTDEHFPILQGWITDRYLLFQYSGTYFTYPISREQLNNYLMKHPERRFYISYNDDNVPYAFGEIIPKTGQPPRLGRLLIGDPKMRSKGLGAIFVGELVAEVKKWMDPAQIDLFVLEENLQAIRCYEKVGFTFLSEGHFSLLFEGKSYAVKKMRMELKPINSV
jgi:RimJ/RimL family protein N-acetyltransferase